MRAALAVAIWIGTAGAALAGNASPALVIPTHPGVPIIINGVDASYAIVEGDWGLGKGIHVQPTVYGGRPIPPEPEVGHYFPSSGRLPGYGRLEIDPPGKPRPPEPFHQSWSAESKSDPVIPADPPPVIMAPPYNQNSIQQNFSAPEFRDPRPAQRRP